MQQWQIGKNRASIGEIEVIISKYPWFSLARKEEFLYYLEKEGVFSKEWAKRVAPYVNSTKVLYKESIIVLSKKGNSVEAKDNDAPIKTREIFVVGGDYFGKEDYTSIKQAGEEVVVKMGAISSEGEAKVVVDKGNDSFFDDEFCTETLAQIYLTQGFYKRAVEVYEKLILLYPEKSTYFALLKEEIMKKI